MYSKIKIAGHPVHPMLINYPVALYTASVVCYIVYGANTNPFWFKVAVVANGAGVLMAIVAALPGFIDWLAIPTPRLDQAQSLSRPQFYCGIARLSACL